MKTTHGSKYSSEECGSIRVGRMRMNNLEVNACGILTGEKEWIADCR